MKRVWDSKKRTVWQDKQQVWEVGGDLKVNTNHWMAEPSESDMVVYDSSWVEPETPYMTYGNSWVEIETETPTETPTEW